MANGVRTTNIDTAVLPDDVLVNAGKSTRRMPLKYFIAQISSQIGPSYETLAELSADLDWYDGAVGVVWGDGAGQGTYVHHGAYGDGNWSYIGPVPASSLSRDQIGAAVDSRIAAMVDIRYVGEWDPVEAAYPSGSTAGDVWLVISDGVYGGVAYEAGDRIIALVDDAAVDDASDWLRLPAPLEVIGVGRGFATMDEAAAYTGDLMPYEMIVTAGRNAIGDGGAATYLRGSTALSGAFTDTSGGIWNIVAGSGVFPEQFGAVANDPAADSYAAFVAARDRLYEQGGGTIFLKSGCTYYLSETLEIDPTRITIRDLGNSVLDWRLKDFVDPNSLAQFVSNESFDSGDTGWSASANQTVTPVFASGGVTWTCSIAGDYVEFGQQIATEAGKKYRFVMTVDEITSTSIGSNTFRTISMSLRPNGVGNGGSGDTLRSASNSSALYDGAGSVFEWTVDCPYDNAYLTVQSNATAGVQAVEVYDAVANECLHVQTPADGNMRMHNTHELAGFKIAGTQDVALREHVVGILFDTETVSFSSRCVMRGVDISDGVGVGLDFRNRAYLIEGHSCRIVPSKTCIRTNPATADAGENITFYGGNIGGAAVGIQNDGGYDLRFFGLSNDFAQQWLVASSGLVEMHGCHLERHPATSDVTGTEDEYAIDLSDSGDFKMFGGRILNSGGGGDPTNATAAFRLRGNARCLLDHVEHYYLNGSDGYAATVEDRGQFEMVGCVDRAGGTAYKVSAVSNELPDIEGDNVPIPYVVLDDTALGAIAMSTADARTGTSSISLTKHASFGAGTEFKTMFLMPVERGRQCALTGYFSVPLQSLGDVDVYFQTYFVSVRPDFDGNGMEIMKQQFVSDIPFSDLDSNVGVDWTELKSRTTRIDASSAHNGFAPAWATHFALQVSLVNAPASAEVLLDDLFFNQF